MNSAFARWCRDLKVHAMFGWETASSIFPLLLHQGHLCFGSVMRCSTLILPYSSSTPLKTWPYWVFLYTTNNGSDIMQDLLLKVAAIPSHCFQEINKKENSLDIFPCTIQWTTLTFRMVLLFEGCFMLKPYCCLYQFQLMPRITFHSYTCNLQNTQFHYNLTILTLFFVCMECKR